MNNHKIFLMSLQEKTNNSQPVMEAFPLLAAVPLAMKAFTALRAAKAIGTGVKAVKALRTGMKFARGANMVKNAVGMGSQKQLPESMGYVAKVKDTVAKIKQDKSVISKQVDAHANLGDRNKSIAVKEIMTANKPKLFRHTKFNPKNVGSEGY